MTATHPIVEAYMAAINASDHAALMTLFTDEAVLAHPVGTFTGTEQIAGFYDPDSGALFIPSDADTATLRITERRARRH